MPYAAPHPCAFPGCGVLVTQGARCEKHHVQTRRENEAARGSAHARGYDRTWRRMRAAFIAQHPLCVHCEARGIVTASREVDHITPHRGDDALRLDWTNLQALCKPCHSTKTRLHDRG